jgi:hypothetical protein
MQTGQAVQTMKERLDYVELLEGIPVFSSCTPSVLREFAAYGVDTVHCAAGQTLTYHARDHNLYVLASGSAILHAGDDVIVDVEPGDYFGTNPTHYDWLNVYVVAVTDLEVLVISPQEVSWLQQASSRHRDASGIEWRIELSTTTRRTSRRHRRRTILINQSA